MSISLRYGVPITAPVAPPTPREIVPAGAFWQRTQLLSPAPDGVLYLFTAPVPFIRTDNAPEIVYRSGVQVDPSDYTLGSTRQDGALNVVTFRAAPLSGDQLVLSAYVMRS